MKVNPRGIWSWLVVLVVGSLSGCSGQPPTTPSSPGSRNLSGIVIDASGACLPGAVVEVIAGQALGQKSAHSGPCDVWWPFNGFSLSDLEPGVSLTLRATAPGYRAQEMTVVPSPLIVEFLLDPLQR